MLLLFSNSLREVYQICFIKSWISVHFFIKLWLIYLGVEHIFHPLCGALNRPITLWIFILHSWKFFLYNSLIISSVLSPFSLSIMHIRYRISCLIISFSYIFSLSNFLLHYFSVLISRKHIPLYSPTILLIFYVSPTVFLISAEQLDPLLDVITFPHISEDVSDLKFSSGCGIDYFSLGFLFITICLVSTLAIRDCL